MCFVPLFVATGCGKSKYSDAGEMDLPTGFIVGGDQARPYELPWQASMHHSVFLLDLSEYSSTYYSPIPTLRNLYILRVSVSTCVKSAQLVATVDFI